MHVLKQSVAAVYDRRFSDGAHRAPLQQSSVLCPPSSGFTLLELLVVVGLIAALSFVLIGGLSGGGKSAALQSAQATLANMVTAARVKAVATGQSARVLVHIDQNSSAVPSRFLRYIAIQVQIGGAWGTTAEVFLPEGIYVVPGNFSTIPTGLFATGTTVPWTKSDGSALRSTALRQTQISSETINASSAEQWVNIALSGVGSTGQLGDLIVATGRVRPPGSFAAGESPVELDNPEAVRGLSLSTYGVPTLVNSRASF